MKISRRIITAMLEHGLEPKSIKVADFKSARYAALYALYENKLPALGGFYICLKPITEAQFLKFGVSLNQIDQYLSRYEYICKLWH